MGAAFPVARKWAAVASAPARPHYVVCNADESEPGTFKDRVLMESDPFALLEAMTIAGVATGSERGFIYVRGEYPLAFERLGSAVRQARDSGLLGPNVLERGFAFDVEIRRGAGAYICGEETALFASIEGFRGEPRSKPPFPVEAGLFGKPTAINNVETLAAVLEVLREGGRAFASIGSSASTGSKLFCVSGRVVRPGLYEVPFATTLSQLLALAGGCKDGRAVKAVLVGGAAGGFLLPSELETPLTFEDLRRAGASLGSGVVLVFDDSVPLPPILRRIAAFFREESCGQCVPCRVGTVRQEELVQRITDGGPTRSEDPLLFRELAQVMRDASICGLGQTASSALESAVAKLGLFGPEDHTR
jgi:NADH-quinone oxidoreductase subunit F